AADARRRALDDPLRYLLLIDGSNHPIGWIAHGDIPAEGGLADSMANPSSPILNKRTTLKDALSMMLDADVQTGIVVDRTGAVQGLLSIDTVAMKMREGEHAAAFDQIPPEPEPGEPGAEEEAPADPAPVLEVGV